jgi:predicted nuclease of predicted toxin-antitoxin system
VLPILVDAGLPHAIAGAFRLLGLDATALGDPGAPAQNAGDDEIVAWCEARGAVLVTADRGRKDPTMLDALAQCRVHAIFVHDDLRAGPTHALARALLQAESRIEAIANSRKLIRHRLRIGGGLDKR